MAIAQIPDYLYHKIHGGNLGLAGDEAEWVLGQIKKQGLRPMRAVEWSTLVPQQIRELPIVWLAEESSKKGIWLKIETQMLEKSCLFKLDPKDVDWWVYQGHIPASEIQQIKD